MRRLISFLLPVLLVLLCFSTVTFAADIPPADADLTGNIVIIHTNDSHGHVGDNMGFSSVSALRQFYENTGADVVMLDAGDTFHGMPFATLNQGEDIVPIINEIGYAAMTIGNHEYDYGAAQLAHLTSQVDFPVVCANIYDDDGNLLYDPNLVLKAGGKTIGVFGLATPETAYKTDPKNVEGITFGDPIEAAREQVEILQAQGVDYIVALAHLGVSRASEVTADKVATAVDGIDIIIDGHSHTQMEDGEPLDTSIILEPHSNTMIASTGCYIQTIGVVTIEPDGNITAKLVDSDDFAEKDPGIDEMIDDINKDQAPQLEEVVGSTPVDLDGEEAHVRTSETNLGDLSADSLIYATGADMAILNGGAIRTSIPAGDITRGNLITVFPFGNYIITKEVSGEAILAALEHGVSGYPAEQGAFPQVAGITFEFDPSQEAGERITNATIGGEPVSDHAKYMVAMNDFIASGGDDYTMFEDFPDAVIYSAFDEILTTYIETEPEILSAPAGRITTSDAPAATEETASAATGDAIESAYTVQKGDSLWDISADILGDGTRWREIYNINKNAIANPDGLEVGQRLELPAA